LLIFPTRETKRERERGRGGGREREREREGERERDEIGGVTLAMAVARPPQ
jgi:hypothetical protein